jgi:transposase
VPRIWAGVDIGKEHHHCVVIDAEGNRLLSRRVLNDEAALTELVADVLALDAEVLWAVDLNHGGAALLLAMLLGRDQHVAYLTGLAVHLAAGSYRGQGKTDAKDAFIIADQARMRRDVGVLRPGDEIAVDLRILTTRRLDLVADRTRAINRLRAALLEIFPALERALDLTNKGPVLLLAGFQTPSAIRAAGHDGLEHYLRERQVRTPDKLARLALQAAAAQQIAVPGEQLAAALVGRQAEGVIALNQEIAELDALIEARFHQHPHAAVIRSLPGMGALLGAEFLAATGGQMDLFGTPDRLAGYAGLAPVPRDSGRVSGNLHRPHRFHRGLLRAMYLAALASLKSCPASRTFYQRKRSEGHGHKQTLIALARRRLNVLWAMLRDGAFYQPMQPTLTRA